MSPKRMPTPVEIGSVTDKTLTIVWSDGHRSSYSWHSLRVHCPCARCKDGVGQIPPTIRAMSMGRVGAYALRFVWSDRHDTGIYPFPLLRFELCECGEHGREREISSPMSSRGPRGRSDRIV